MEVIRIDLNHWSKNSEDIDVSVEEILSIDTNSIKIDDYVN